MYTYIYICNGKRFTLNAPLYNMSLAQQSKIDTELSVGDTHTPTPVTATFCS